MLASEVVDDDVTHARSAARSFLVVVFARRAQCREHAKATRHHVVMLQSRVVVGSSSLGSTRANRG